MTDENKAQIETLDQEIVPATITHRVKFYQLNTDTHWEDKGTGHCVYQLVIKTKNKTTKTRFLN